MSHKNHHATPQICGTWDLQREINSIEFEERRKLQFANAKLRTQKRQQILKPYMKEVGDIFKGTRAEETVTDMFHRWEKHRLNKELIHAAAELKRCLVPVSIDYTVVMRYNIFLKIQCKQYGISCYNDLKL